MDKAESDPTGHLEGNFNRWFQDVSLVVGMSAVQGYHPGLAFTPEDVEEFSNASRRLLEKAGVEPLLKSNISMVGSN
jgi:hypothetical protein